MWDKKGDVGFSLYFFPTLLFFALIIIVFSMLFFATNLTKSPNLLVKGERYQDSSKLLTVLNSQTEGNITIAELISLASQDEIYKKNLTREIEKLIQKLPKPPKDKDLAQVNFATPSAVSASLQDANWHFEIQIDHSYLLKVGKEATIVNYYFVQRSNIPLSNKKIAKVKLYLDCFSCSEEGIDAIA